MGERTDQIGEHGGWYARPSEPARAAVPAEGVPPHEDDTAEIRADIEQTRAEMSRTIDEIQERLDPQHLREQAVGQIKDQFQEAKATVREATIGKVEDMVQSAGYTVSRAGNSVIDTIKENPLPVALIGLGFGLLFANSGSSGSRKQVRGRGRYAAATGYGRTAGYSREATYGAAYGRGEEGMLERGQEAIGETADRAQEAARDLASSARQTAEGLVDQGRETAEYLADRAQEQAEWAEDAFHTAVRRNPLAVGAVALALGAVTGAVLPQTEAENELMGPARDNLVENAQEAAGEALDRVQRVAGRVADRAQRAVTEEVRSPQPPAH